MFLEPTEAWQLLSLCTALTVAFLLAVHFTKLKAKVPLFYSWIGAIAIFGGAVAFLLPIALNSGFGKDDDGRVLRQLILYTTGGVLGVITLGESHRKNNQEKEKNENDHTRQVYAERRSRYTKAIERLTNEKAAVRLGGVYTLVSLVDEWLADESFKEESDRHKEGQVIINNLCSYIRSPFLIAEKLEEYEARKELNMLEELEAALLPEEGSPRLQTLRKRFIDSHQYKEPEDITAGYAELREEQDVRRAIFAEMSKRSSIVTEVSQDEVSVIPGPWSDFDFDFSRAPIFYPLNNLTIEKAFFSSASFYNEPNFIKTVFIQNADFSWATFNDKAKFNGSKFIQKVTFDETIFNEAADFSDQEDEISTFRGKASFKRVNFTHEANFNRVNFMQEASFRNAVFDQKVNFFKAVFHQYTDFYKVNFEQDATFFEAEFCGEDDKHYANFYDATFKNCVDFHKATFKEKADFRGAKFKMGAEFYDSFFGKKADFHRATFRKKEANFSHATFYGYADFSKATFAHEASFGSAEFFQHVNFWQAYFAIYKPTFARENSKARFSVCVEQKKYNFMVREDSLPIPLGTAELNGVSRHVPVGTVLFDPSSGDTSQPAKPLDKSTDGEEDKPE